MSFGIEKKIELKKPEKPILGKAPHLFEIPSEELKGKVVLKIPVDNWPKLNSNSEGNKTNYEEVYQNSSEDYKYIKVSELEYRRVLEKFLKDCKRAILQQINALQINALRSEVEFDEEKYNELAGNLNLIKAFKEKSHYISEQEMEKAYETIAFDCLMKVKRGESVIISCQERSELYITIQVLRKIEDLLNKKIPNGENKQEIIRQYKEKIKFAIGDYDTILKYIQHKSNLNKFNLILLDDGVYSDNLNRYIDSTVNHIINSKELPSNLANKINVEPVVIAAILEKNERTSNRHQPKIIYGLESLPKESIPAKTILFNQISSSNYFQDLLKKLSESTGISTPFHASRVNGLYDKPDRGDLSKQNFINPDFQRDYVQMQKYELNEKNYNLVSISQMPKNYRDTMKKFEALDPNLSFELIKFYEIMRNTDKNIFDSLLIRFDQILFPSEIHLLKEARGESVEVLAQHLSETALSSPIVSQLSKVITSKIPRDIVQMQLWIAELIAECDVASRKYIYGSKQHYFYKNTCDMLKGIKVDKKGNISFGISFPKSPET